MTRPLIEGDRVTFAERFITKTHVTEDDCWQWNGAMQPNGYGYFWNGKRMVYAHRFAYAVFNGDIPEGLDLDHLCRNRACVRPSHLEAVTRRVNLLRGDTIAAAHHEGRDCGSEGCKNCQRHRQPVEAAS